MGTLIENLNEIYSIKGDIRSAIEDKGVDMTGMSFPDYPTAIGQISTGGTFVTETLSVSVNNTYYPGQGVDGFSQVVVDVPQSVTGFTEKDITEKNITLTNLNNSASFVASGAFQNNFEVQTAYLPNVSIVYTSAFNNCTHLQQVSLPNVLNIEQFTFTGAKLNNIYLPKCRSIGSFAFYNCKSLSQAIFPECISVYNQAFRECNSLEKVDLPKCHTMTSGIFQNCSSLSDVNLPRVSAIPQSAFYGCTSISQMTLPLCTYVYQNAFNGNYNKSMELQSLYLPLCISIYSNVFAYCPNLSDLSVPMCINFYTRINNSVISTLSLPAVSGLSTNAFGDCTNLISLTLGTGTYNIPTYNANMLTNTPIMSGNGSIYVDAAMYDKWITTTGWSSLSDRFMSVGNTDPMLSYSDGLVYGKTTVLGYNFHSYLGVAYSSVTELSLPNCICMFNTGGSYIQNVYLPECQYINGCSFATISTIDLPKCKVLEDLQSCNNLASISLPVCEELRGIRTFSACYNLRSINLPVCNLIESIGETAQNCSLTLGSTSVCDLLGTIHNRVTSIYVPASLVDAYKSAPNWSNYSNKIFPIE